jgi:predicted exporter
MKLKQICLAGLIALIFGIGLGALSINWHRAFETDIFKLIQTSESDPNFLVQDLLRNEFSKEIQLVLSGEAVARDPEFLNAFRDRIIDEPLFEEAFTPALQWIPERIVKEIYQDRHWLLLPRFIAEFPEGIDGKTVAQTAVDNLDSFLSQPESLAYDSQLTEDPLLLIPGIVDSLKTQQDTSTVSVDSVVFTVRLTAPPGAYVDPIVRSIDELAGYVAAYNSQWQLLDNGYHRYASESKSRIRGEIFRLNLLTLGITLALIFLLLRRPLWVLPVVAIVGTSIAGAMVTTVAVFGSIHVLSLVIGSILSGIAIDYGFHILLKREETGSLDFKETLLRIRTPLIASCLSTVAGFLVLLTNPIRAINEVGVFVASGLVLALLLCTLTALALDKTTGPSKFARFPGYPPVFKPSGYLFIGLGGLALLMGVVSILRIDYRDEIGDLQIGLEDAPANESKIRELTNGSEDTRYWVTTAPSILELLDNQTALLETTATTEKAIAQLFPNTATLNAFIDFRNGSGSTFPEAFREALVRSDFEPSAFEPFFSSLSELWDQDLNPQLWEETFEKYPDLMEYPLSLLLGGEKQNYWAVSITSKSIETEIELEHSFRLAALDTLNSLLQEYRSRVSHSLWISLALIALIIAAVFGLSKAGKILSIPVIASLFSIALIVLTGSSVSLFHLVGFLLGACIVLDYAVFCVNRSAETPPLSIRASAATTIASFAALSSSHIPAVSDLGWTVLLVVAFGLVLSEIAPFHKS